MLRIDLETLGLIALGVKPLYEVVVNWQEPETYTEEDYLQDAGDISTSMSEGRYEIANTAIALKNENYYFSRRLAKELPNNKLVEIRARIGQRRIEVFRGIVGKNWTLTPTTLTLNVNA